MDITIEQENIPSMNLNKQGLINMDSNQTGGLSTGAIIDGKWVLIEPVGKGGMGEVYPRPPTQLSSAMWPSN